MPHPPERPLRARHRMIMDELAVLTDPALLLLRLLIAAVFGASGWSHVRAPEKRGENIGLPPGATAALGVAELAGAASVALGVGAQAGAAVLIAVMAGAIAKKVFVWRTGFWGESAGGGWFYDLLYLVCCLVVVSTGGGAWALV